MNPKTLGTTGAAIATIGMMAVSMTIPIRAEASPCYGDPESASYFNCMDKYVYQPHFRRLAEEKRRREERERLRREQLAQRPAVPTPQSRPQGAPPQQAQTAPPPSQATPSAAPQRTDGCATKAADLRDPKFRDVARIIQSKFGGLNALVGRWELNNELAALFGGGVVLILKSDGNGFTGKKIQGQEVIEGGLQVCPKGGTNLDVKIVKAGVVKGRVELKPGAEAGQFIVSHGGGDYQFNRTPQATAAPASTVASRSQQ